MIEVENLTKFYGNIKAIEDVSFRVEKGEILGFLGPNGAGKTTTMRILTGYMPASGGTCRVGGDDVFENPLGVKHRIGYLPEFVPLYPELTVKEYLHFVAKLKGVPSSEINDSIERITTKCGLESVKERLISKLSKGFRQRVGLAQALVHDPPVIILDEPTVGLDPAQIREVRELIQGLGQDHTIILSSHILPEVSQVCDRVLIINKGHIIAEDTPDNLASRTTGSLTCECLLKAPEDKLKAFLEHSSIFDDYTLERAEGSELWKVVFPMKDADLRPKLSRAIFENGFDLYEIFTHRATLEDVFLQLITEEDLSTDTADKAQAAINSSQKEVEE